MSDLDYKFAHVNRHTIIADWLMSDDEWLAMAARLHDRLNAAADRMAPFHDYSKCARCEEAVNNPKKHDCAPSKQLPSLTIVNAQQHHRPGSPVCTSMTP